jgi:peptide/nickel transport system permease protein
MSSSGRRAWLSGVRRLARLYLKSRIGMTGLVIIVFFLLIAVLAPVLGTNDPISATVGAPFDVPAWATIFPSYSRLPVDAHPINATFITATDPNSWTWSGTINKSVGPIPGGGPVGFTNALLVNSTVSPTANETNDPFLPDGTAFFTMSRTFQFTGNPPATFQATAVLQPIKMQNVSTIYVKMIIIDPKGNNFSLASTQLSALNFEISIPSSANGVWRDVVVSSGLLPLSGIPVYHNITNPPAVVFTQPGTYNFTMQIQGVVDPGATAPSIKMRVAFLSLYMRGSAYGVLGTDNFGRDVWSQFVWGSQISLLIGVLSGIGAVALGAIVGIAGGYLGGNWDEMVEIGRAHV